MRPGWHQTDLERLAREASGAAVRRAILAALDASGGQVTMAARALGVARQELYRRARHVGLDLSREAASRRKLCAGRICPVASCDGPNKLKHE